MEATFKENPTTIATSVVTVDIYTEHTGSRNMETNFKGNGKSILMSVIENNLKADDSIVVYGFSLTIKVQEV